MKTVNVIPLSNAVSRWVRPAMSFLLQGIRHESKELAEASSLGMALGPCKFEQPRKGQHKGKIVIKLELIIEPEFKESDGEG